jgi:hypothetical protein
MMGLPDIGIVIGSWGSYNDCNERALGSSWIDLTDYNDWDEIVEELEKQGFELDGIDEELFIQDVEGIPCNSQNWDYVHPQNLFETLKASGILDDSYKRDVFEAYLEIRSFRDWEELVDSYGTNWDDDIILYPNMDFNDLAYHMIHEVCCYEIPKYLENYIDYDAYGRDLSYEGFYEYANGIIELR